MTNTALSAAQPADPIRYTLSFAARQNHYVEVEASVPTAGRATIELMMPVWTPGSYMVREYSRNVEDVRARGDNGRPLGVEKSAKNRWRIQTAGAPRVTVVYRVYGHEMSVRTNWIESDFALINGAPTFMTLVDAPARAHEVTLNLPAAWKTSMTGLSPVAAGPHRYRAPDYDALVDSPIVAGNPAVHEFEVDGKKHYLVNQGEAGVFDGARAARDLGKIVREHKRMWGSLPYDKYVFLNMITESGGGLEHRNSSVLMTTRWATRTRKAYVSWLELASHEFFHLWNVKRLRPIELGPFDYERENTTRSLWIVEGITDYFGELAVHRAGLSTREEYLEALSNQIEALQTTPGRLVQPVDLASFDAWIKYYRPDENSANVSVSYYTKGAVLGFLLDAKIRKATGGAKSLEDVLKAAYQEYSGAKGYTEEQFRALAERVSGLNLKTFWETAVDGTGELDYAEALGALGMRFKAPPAPRSDVPAKAFLGLNVRNDAGRMIVTQVQRGTPAFDAGINVDDEILAIDDFRVRADQLPARLDQYRAGDTVSVLVARREQLQRISVKLGSEPVKAWRLEIDPSAGETEKKLLTAWLGA
jgi:predicted metalloprotease with PDZ domain